MFLFVLIIGESFIVKVVEALNINQDQLVVQIVVNTVITTTDK